MKGYKLRLGVFIPLGLESINARGVWTPDLSSLAQRSGDGLNGEL